MREFFSIEELSPEEFRELQMKNLEILVYFKDFCKAHGLTFYLAGGTAIGALRHKGFIPWDDDIDVFMPRPDYERLTELWAQKADTSKYIFCRSTENRNFHHHAAGVMDITTTYIEQRNMDSDIPQGLVMDVIPLDGCPDHKLPRIIQLFHAFVFAVFNAQRLPENKSKTVYNLTKLVLGVVRSPKLRYRLWRSAEKHMTKFDFYGGKNITELIGNINGMLTTHPLEDFASTVDVEFEGYQMPLMKGYDAYLRSVHGDYMELPPEDKRIPKVKLVYANLNEPYTKYRGRYYMVDQKG